MVGSCFLLLKDREAAIAEVAKITAEFLQRAEFGARISSMRHDTERV
jgi:hypothetical protein